MAATIGAIAALSCVESSEVSRTAVTDSAGVRIVSHDLSDIEVPPFRRVGSFDLQMGVVDGGAEYSFSGIVDLALADDGRMVLSDRNAQELRVFDAEGRHLATIGGSGEGPGEFAGTPTIAGLSGDTIHAFDARAGRVSRFLLDGEFLASDGVISGSGNRIRALHLRAGGGYLGVSPWVQRDVREEFYEARLELDSLVVEHLASGGGAMDTVLVTAERRRLRRVQDGGGGVFRTAQGDPPYLPEFFLASNGEVEVTGRSVAFELAVSRPGGQPTLLRVEGAQHAADHGDIRSYQEAAIRSELGEQPLSPMMRQLLLDNLPDRLPAFARVVMARSGDLWVARSSLDEGAERDWLVFAPDGELRGSVQTPQGMRLLAVAPDFLVGEVRNDLDVPFVRRYPFLVGLGG